ncbi:ribonuclease H-like domain-containing protein [Alkalihalobacillus alcalophilus]|uniref:ribonuclease H-like domain-containing protein n=1 Tax=Alkalihalobacillus alcalophilus TaxID=1445 RepID=UPI00145528C4|nr:ribonuclease H-like domain-containing protein [Alkalihalobacillus alcalophilus]
MLKNKLNRMKSHLSLNESPTLTDKRSVTKTIVTESPLHSEEEQSLFKKWEKLGAKPYWFDGHYIFIKETAYPIEHQHGLYPFSDLEQVTTQWKQFNEPHPLSSADTDIENLLFFDTETTGLSSGAGHSIFLLGFSQVVGSNVVVKQYILPGPEAEVAFYHYFLDDLGSNKKLVTYNGKAFDWPKVKTRHTFVREQVPKLPKVGHFDLLHAARRLWKETLPSCKLAIIEEEILELKREQDTPGYLAPMLYFDYLNEQEPLYLEGIIEHHEQDVLSLITLYIHLSHLITSPNKVAIENREEYEIARWFSYIGNNERAAKMFWQLSQREEDIHLAKASLYQYALIQKKQKDEAVALQCFLTLINYKPYQIDCLIEAAKLKERFEKDIFGALTLTNQALKLLEEREFISNQKISKLIMELQKRKQRLEIKLLKGKN